MMKKINIACLLLVLLGFYSCNSDAPKEEEIAEDVTLNEEGFSDLSIYNLPSVWTNQDGQDIELQELRGDVLVMVMIYTSCQAACPRLVADMRHIKQEVDQFPKSDRIKYVLVSIDPKVDTPERLKEFTIENKMEGDQWVFLRSDEESTREFAQVLAVNYKQITPIDFSHSNIISVFNPEGELVYQEEGLGIEYDPTVEQIKKQLEMM